MHGARVRDFTEFTLRIDVPLIWFILSLFSPLGLFLSLGLWLLQAASNGSSGQKEQNLCVGNFATLCHNSTQLWLPSEQNP
jgi:hypothetical protein